MATTSVPENTSISADEIALYDRQIRLWGVQAQENLRKANILLINIKSLGNEIAKNLVLAGIHSLTIYDHSVVEPQDLGAQFLIRDGDIGSRVSEFIFIFLPPLQPPTPL
jgi:ubiquitin-like 1-activating enzyme E1 A